MKMRKYEGKCKLYLDTMISVKADFELVISEEGNISVVCNTNEIHKMIGKFSKGQVKVRLKGTTLKPQGKIEIPEMYLNVIRIPKGQLNFNVLSPVEIEFKKIKQNNEVEIRSGLTNFVFNGCKVSKIDEWLARDKFTVKVKNQKIVLKQIKDYKEIVESLKKTRSVRVTSEAISHIKFKEIDELRKILKNLETLLSFASGNYITTLYENVYKKEKLIRTILNPFKTMPYNHRRFVIDCDHHGNCDLKTFLETAYVKYERLRDILGLTIVIEYYVTAKIFRISQVKYLLGAIALECLKSHFPDYLKKHGKKPVTRGRDYFRRIMNALSKEFKLGYNQKDLQFIYIRNSIVHEGNFPQKVQPLDEISKLFNLIDRTILTILGYKGNQYLNIARQFRKEKLK